MTEHPAVDLARRAFATETAWRLVEHVVMCDCVAAIAGPENKEAAEDVIAYDPAAAAQAAGKEFSELAPDDAERIVTRAQDRVRDALAVTSHALIVTYGVLGGTTESTRGLDAEHVALVGALALLSGADELFDPNQETK